MPKALSGYQSPALEMPSNLSVWLEESSSKGEEITWICGTNQRGLGAVSITGL